VPHLGRQRRVQRLAVGEQGVERVAVGGSLAAVEAVRQIADRAAALAGK
jgi:hypothetical protein